MTDGVGHGRLQQQQQPLKPTTTSLHITRQDWTVPACTQTTSFSPIAIIYQRFLGERSIRVPPDGALRKIYNTLPSQRVVRRVYIKRLQGVLGPF